VDAARETGRLPANVRPNFLSLFHLNLLLFLLSFFLSSLFVKIFLCQCLCEAHSSFVWPSASHAAIQQIWHFRFHSGRWASHFFLNAESQHSTSNASLRERDRKKMEINNKKTYQYMKSRASRHKCQNHNQQKVKPKPETYQSVSQRLKVAYNWNANGNITSSWHLFPFFEQYLMVDHSEKESLSFVRLWDQRTLFITY